MERCSTLREGVLDVKFPPDNPKRSLHKAWRKLCVCAVVLYPSGRGEPHLILQLAREYQEKGLQPIKASRDGLRLFRCQSKSRPQRTWALSSSSVLLVYLAAENERETQSWMQAIRDGLWPPIHNATDNPHNLSLIDDEKSVSSGILGLYGRLVRTSDDMISIIHPHWQDILMRWKQEDVLNVCLVRKIGNDESTAGVLKVTIRGSTNKNHRDFQFYSDTATSVVSWFKSKNDESKTLTKKENPDDNNSTFLIFKKSELLSTEYAKIQNLKEKSQISNEIVNEGFQKNLLETLDAVNILGISNEFLNSSVSPITSPIQSICTVSLREENGNSDLEECLQDVYEPLYEDIERRSSSVGAYTVYEEIEDEDSEYVPPLPPELPNRPAQKPNSLRLLKLSESVAEALKLAEESPTSTANHNSRIFNKVIGKKSKSTQASPLREKPIPIFGEKLNLKRTLSAPVDSTLKHTELPSKTVFDDGTPTNAVKNSVKPLSNLIGNCDVLIQSKETPGDLKQSDTGNLKDNEDLSMNFISRNLEADYIHMR